MFSLNCGGSLGLPNPQKSKATVLTHGAGSQTNNAIGGRSIHRRHQLGSTSFISPCLLVALSHFKLKPFCIHNVAAESSTDHPGRSAYLSAGLRPPPPHLFFLATRQVERMSLEKPNTADSSNPKFGDFP